MPEFRFRRKKQGPSQRSGRNDAEVTATRQIQKNEKLVKVVLEPPQEMAVNGVGGAKDVVSCMRMGKVEEEGEEEGGKFVRQTHRNEERSSFVQEREKFFELLKAKYPEQACSLEMGVAGMEEGVGVTGDGDLAMSEKCEQTSVNRTTVMVEPTRGNGFHRDELDKEVDGIVGFAMETLPEQPAINPPRNYGECLYLRHGKSLLRCPMPSPITLSTIKNLFINMFDLNPSLIFSTSSHIYLQDKKMKLWNRLENISMVTDHSTLLLADSALSHSSFSGGNQAGSESNPPLDQLSQLTSQSSLDSFNGHMMSTAESTPTSHHKRNGLWRSGHTYQVQDLSTLPDSLVLQKNPPSLLPHTFPSPSFPCSSSTSSSSSLSSSNGDKVMKEKVLSRVHDIHASLGDLKSDLSSLRQSHTLKMAELDDDFGTISQRIMAAVTTFGLASLQSRDKSVLSASLQSRDERVMSTSLQSGDQRVMNASLQSRDERVKWSDIWMKRSEMSDLKEAYFKSSVTSLHNLQMLECTVDEMSVDVVQRRCKVVDEDVNILTTTLIAITEALKDTKSQYQPLTKMMKTVMEEELSLIVNEERFLEEEWPRLEEAIEKCDQLAETLLTLLRYASIQSQRMPANIHFPIVSEPDRAALMNNITAISPNPDYRMMSILVAEELGKKKREMKQKKNDGIKTFEAELRSKKKQLHRAVDIEHIDGQREVRIRAMYTEDMLRRGRSFSHGQVKEKGWREDRDGDGRSMSQEMVGNAVKNWKKVPTIDPTQEVSTTSGHNHRQEVPATSGHKHSQEVPVTSGHKHSQEVPTTSRHKHSQEVHTNSGHKHSQEVPATSGHKHSQEVPTTSGHKHSQEVPASSGHKHSQEVPTTSGHKHSQEVLTTSGHRHSEGVPTTSGHRHSEGVPATSGHRHSEEVPTTSGHRHSEEVPTTSGHRHSEEVPVTLQEVSQKQKLQSLPVSHAGSSRKVMEYDIRLRRYGHLYNDSQVHPHSQPEVSHLAAFRHESTPEKPPLGQTKDDLVLQETKRKSFGYVGEFSAVKADNNLLERKKEAASKDSGLSFPNSTASGGVAYPQRSAAYKSVGSFVSDTSGTESTINSSTGISKVNGISGVTQSEPHKVIISPATISSTNSPTNSPNFGPMPEASPPTRNAWPSQSKACLGKNNRHCHIQSPVQSPPPHHSNKFIKRPPPISKKPKRPPQGNVCPPQGNVCPPHGNARPPPQVNARPPRYIRTTGDQHHSGVSPGRAQGHSNVPTMSSSRNSPKQFSPRISSRLSASGSSHSSVDDNFKHLKRERVGSMHLESKLSTSYSDDSFHDSQSSGSKVELQQREQLKVENDMLPTNRRKRGKTGKQLAFSSPSPSAVKTGEVSQSNQLQDHSRHRVDLTDQSNQSGRQKGRYQTCAKTLSFRPAAVQQNMQQPQQQTVHLSREQKILNPHSNSQLQFQNMHPPHKPPSLTDTHGTHNNQTSNHNNQHMSGGEGERSAMAGHERLTNGEDGRVFSRQQRKSPQLSYHRVHPTSRNSEHQHLQQQHRPQEHHPQEYQNLQQQQQHRPQEHHPQEHQHLQQQHHPQEHQHLQQQQHHPQEHQHLQQQHRPQEHHPQEHQHLQQQHHPQEHHPQEHQHLQQQHQHLQQQHHPQEHHPQEPQHQQEHQLNHPHLQQVSGIPLRSVKSAHSSSHTSQGHTHNGNGDTPLTSHPRSHLEAVRMRSTSNRQQITKETQSDKNLHLNYYHPVAGDSTTTGVASSLKGPRTQLRVPSHVYASKTSGHGNGVVNANGNNAKRIIIGSLV